jgi:hypothetical protein
MESLEPPRNTKHNRKFGRSVLSFFEKKPKLPEKNLGSIPDRLRSTISIIGFAKQQLDNRNENTAYTWQPINSTEIVTISSPTSLYEIRREYSNNLDIYVRKIGQVIGSDGQYIKEVNTFRIGGDGLLRRSTQIHHHDVRVSALNSVRPADFNGSTQKVMERGREVPYPVDYPENNVEMSLDESNQLFIDLVSAVLETR